MLIANLYISIICPERCLKSHRQNVAKFLKTGPECSLIKIQSCSLKIASQNSYNSSWEWLPNSLFIMDFSMILEKPTFCLHKIQVPKTFLQFDLSQTILANSMFLAICYSKNFEISVHWVTFTLFTKNHTKLSFLDSYHLISKRHTTMLLVFSLSIGLVSFQRLLLARKLNFKNIIFQSNTTGSIYTL